MEKSTKKDLKPSKSSAVAADPEPETEKELFHHLLIEDVRYKTKLNKKFLNRKAYQPHDPSLINSFIPGTIRDIFVKKGNKVKKGEKLMELEAMKMVNTIFSEWNAEILEVAVKSGDQVAKNQLLLRLKLRS